MEFLDITDHFFKLAGQLSKNDVAKCSNFSLFEGTHALEIANKNLDTGCIKLSSVETKVSNFDFDSESPLDLPSILSILEQLFKLTFVWLDNNQLLSTTVLSCVYVEKLLVKYTKHESLRHATLFRFTDECELQMKEQKLQRYEAEFVELKKEFPTMTKDSPKFQRLVRLQNYILTHKVFRSIMLGLLYFVRFVVKISAAGGLYQEEDVVLQSLNLDLLDTVEDIHIMKELVISSLWMMKNYQTGLSNDNNVDEKCFGLLNELLIIVKNLLEFSRLISKDIGLNLDDKLLGSGLSDQVSVPSNATSFIKTIIKSLDNFVENEDFLNALKDNNTNIYAKYCFSKGIQKRLGNIRPINEIASSTEVDYESIKKQYFISFKDYLSILFNMNSDKNTNILEINRFLQQFYYNSAKNNVILKAFAQLFFVRDDKTILGSRRVFLIHLLLGNMNYISGYETNTMHLLFLGHGAGRRYSVLDIDPVEFVHLDAEKYPAPTSRQSLEILLNYSLVGIKKKFIFCEAEHKISVKQKAADFFLAFEPIHYELLSNVANNPSRQRQVLSRLIVPLDSLQVVSEQLDLLLYDKYNFNDSIPSENGLSPALPLSSYVYYVKLVVMLNYSLKGIELDIYKTWEYPIIYWYNYYLLDNLLGHVDRQVRYNNYKIFKLEKKIEEYKKKRGNAFSVILKDFGALSKVFQNDVNFTFHFNNVLNKSKDVSVNDCLEMLQTKLDGMKLVGSHLEQLKLLYKAEAKLNHSIFILLAIYRFFGLLNEPNFNYITGLIKNHSPASAKSTTSFYDRLYQLRMKSFATAGVPEFLKYETYEWNVDEVISSFATINKVDSSATVIHFPKLLAVLHTVIEYLSIARTSFKQFSNNLLPVGLPDKLIETPSQAEFNRLQQLIKSCIVYSLSISKLEKILQEIGQDSITKAELLSYFKSEGLGCKVQVESHHSYYPLVSIEKQQ